VDHGPLLHISPGHVYQGRCVEADRDPQLASHCQIAIIGRLGGWLGDYLSPSERSEWRRYCFRSICVNESVSVRSGPVNQTSLKQFKLA